MRIATIVCRVLLGVIFLFSALNMFFNLVPMPQPAAPGAAFLSSLMETGYFMPFLKGVEIVCALMLIFNFFAPLALVIIAPVVVNIFLFHAFLDNGGLPLAIVLVALTSFLGYAYRHNFAAVLQRKAHPLSQKVSIKDRGREPPRPTRLRPAEQL